MREQTIFIIPVRMASTRLPNKPLALIDGKPMIQHVFERTRQASLGPVVVACDHPDVADIIQKAGGQCVMTDPDLPSGSDRIYQALMQHDQAGKFTQIVNVQGDLPTISKEVLEACLLPLQDALVDIATLATPIHSDSERDDPNVVKIALTQDPLSPCARALYFSRAPIPYGAETYFHHIGLYAYRRKALHDFIQLPPSPLEKTERLEQLRALEAGMTIGIGFIETAPWGVDTQADLERVRAYMRENK
ncbi:MAG: 3-deoxy-manno-octulosonate cytidylyltransferase [Candidatus Nucleicultricaceae bacterium]